MDHEDFTLHERLTRSLAYMLRHQPDEFDLEVDRYGWAELGEVVRALTERVGSPVEEEDVHEALAAADRPRYEVKEGRIRALYGHSIEVDPGDSDEPPDELYAVVRGRDVPNVERDGLKSVRRTFIHLSLTKEDARDAGRRLARRYAVVTVAAGDAWEDGIDFYDRTSIFLSEEETALWAAGALDYLVARCARVVVTRGADGARVLTRSGERVIAAAPADPVDATGAGDVFGAAFILAMRAGEEFAGRVAAACAAAACEVRGPGVLPSLTEIDARFHVGLTDVGAGDAPADGGHPA